MATVDSRRGADFDPLAPEVHQGLPAWFGIGPGLVAGAVMLVVVVILALARGEGLLWTPKLVATTFLGPTAMAGGFGTALFGLLAHFAMSVLLAMAFVRVVGRTTRRRAMFAGMLYGIAIWAGSQFLVLPWASPYLALEFGTVWPFFLGHFSYGLIVASTIPTVADIDARPQAYIDPLEREVHP